MQRNKLNDYKEIFLNKYNPLRSVSVAVDMAIRASIQHNQIYMNESVSNDERKKIRLYWSEQIVLFKDNYGFSNDVNKFIDLVIKFRDDFRSINENTIFNISHSQKSLSVYAKHLWCLNIIDEPGICPVDRIILSKTNCPYHKRTWTKIDNAEDYIYQFNFISEMASLNNLSVATWELINF